MIFEVLYLFRCKRDGCVFACYTQENGKYFCEGAGERVEVSRPKACCPICNVEHWEIETLWQHGTLDALNNANQP